MNKIKIGTWNVHGLSKKLADDDVFDCISSLYFVALTETWTTLQSNVNFSGYGTIHKFRQKRKKKGRPHGGILFLYKAKYKHHVQQIHCANQDILVVKINGHAIGHVRDVFLLNVYVTPNMTPEGSTNFFDCIEQLLLKYTTEGDTLLMGDFNARTGNLTDCEVTSTDTCHKFIDLPENTSEINCQTRNNCDSKVNKYGKMLTELCQTTQHMILNGRFLGDSLGYQTYMSTNGCSAVDYILANAELYQIVQYFRVSPLCHLSDHCMIETCLGFKGQPIENIVDDNDDSVVHPLYDKFQGGRDCNEMYVMSLLDNDSQDRMCSFLTESYPNSSRC
jgi:exonuclease III